MFRGFPGPEPNKSSYVTDAGVADWRHDMENCAYRRDLQAKDTLKQHPQLAYDQMSTAPIGGQRASDRAIASLRFTQGQAALAPWAWLAPARAPRGTGVRSALVVIVVSS